jgi:hemoglobin
MATKQTVFERYGGFAKVSRVVMAFYEKVLDSPILSPYFSHSDMKRLIDHQTRFVATLMGGPASYTDDHLERIHAPLGITDGAFSEALALLSETLEEFGYEPEDVRMVESEFRSRRGFIVRKG